MTVTIGRRELLKVSTLLRSSLRRARYRGMPAVALASAVCLNGEVGHLHEVGGEVGGNPISVDARTKSVIRIPTAAELSWRKQQAAHNGLPFKLQPSSADESTRTLSGIVL